jgi:hypothetical protein
MGMQSKNRAKHKKEFDGASVAVKILASSMRTYIQTSVESKGTKAPQRTLCALRALMLAPESYFGTRNWDAGRAGRR